jgi:hypothetical protein
MKVLAHRVLTASVFFNGNELSGMTKSESPRLDQQRGR